METPEGTTPESKIEQIKNRLLELSVSNEQIEKILADLGVTSLEDMQALTEQDLLTTGMKIVPARKLVAAFAPAKPSPSASAEAASAMTAASMSFNTILPAVPADASWLEALRTGGVLKVEQSTVISAIRAALACRAGLYEIPDRLTSLMEKFADENQEQVDPEFFKLRKQMTRRSYGDIFEAIPGLDGTYVTEARKKQLFQRIDQSLWPAIFDIYNAIKNWQESWMQGAANPMVMMGAIMGSMSGGTGMMPPGMMQPPDTGVLRDTADAMADGINKVFAGTGVQIAAALAYEASRIKETLENPRLPALTGAANRDQMLRQLGVAVSATYPRLETNLTQFVLGVMQVKDQSAGPEELQYFGALFMLGSQIPWDQLGDRAGSRKPTSIGR